MSRCVLCGRDGRRTCITFHVCGPMSTSAEEARVPRITPDDPTRCTSQIERPRFRAAAMAESQACSFVSFVAARTVAVLAIKVLIRIQIDIRMSSVSVGTAALPAQRRIRDCPQITRTAQQVPATPMVVNMT